MQPVNPPKPARPISSPRVVAASATAMMFVLMVAIGNPSVTDSILGYTAKHDGFWARVLQSFAQVAWNLGRLGNDVGRLYLAALLTDLVVLALVFGFVRALARRVATFGYALAAGWIGVIAAVLIGGYVRPLVLDRAHFDPGTGEAVWVFFGATSPGTYQLFLGIVFGAVVGAVAATVAVLAPRLSRR